MSELGEYLGRLERCDARDEGSPNDAKYVIRIHVQGHKLCHFRDQNLVGPV